MKVVYADRSNVMVKSLDYGEEEEVSDFGFTTGWSVFYGGDALVQYIYPMYTGGVGRLRFAHLTEKLLHTTIRKWYVAAFELSTIRGIRMRHSFTSQ